MKNVECTISAVYLFTYTYARYSEKINMQSSKSSKLLALLIILFLLNVAAGLKRERLRSRRKKPRTSIRKKEINPLETEGTVNFQLEPLIYW